MSLKFYTCYETIKKSIDKIWFCKKKNPPPKIICLGTSIKGSSKHNGFCSQSVGSIFYDYCKPSLNDFEYLFCINITKSRGRGGLIPVSLLCSLSNIFSTKYVRDLSCFYVQNSSSSLAMGFRSTPLPINPWQIDVITELHGNSVLRLTAAVSSLSNHNSVILSMSSL